MSFPETRPRRLRRTLRSPHGARDDARRPTTSSTRCSSSPGRASSARSRRCPGSSSSPSTRSSREAEEVAKLGIPAVILFGVPDKKDDVGSEAWHPEGVVQRALRAIKKAVPELVLVVDACFCEYTTPRPLRRGRRRRRRQRRDAREPRPRRALVRARRRRPDRAVGHDGRLRRLPARVARRGRLRAGRPPGLLGQVRLGLLRSVPRPRSTPRPRSAIARATRWIPPTCARRCARSRSTSTRAPTSSWSSRRSPTWT